MKKSLRLFGTLLALVSLTACQDLGSEVTEAQAAQRQTEIQNADDTKVAHQYTLTLSETATIDVMGEKESVKASMKASYDLDKLYAYINMDMGKEAEGENGENWIFYKDNYVHYVRKTKGGKAEGYKVQMTEAEAKAEINTQIDSTIAGETNLEEIIDGLGSMAGNTSSMTTGMKVDASTKYYSKGEGNLSLVAKQKGSAKTAEYTASYSFDATITFNEYLLSNCSFKLNYSASGGGQKASIKLVASIKGSKGCSVSYPTYTETAQ